MPDLSGTLFSPMARKLKVTSKMGFGVVLEQKNPQRVLFALRVIHIKI
jgi:hypothetical protein